MKFTVNGRKIALVEGDITKAEADAIVNAANSRLAGGGGVDGAIHRAGGPPIMRELDEIRPQIGGRCETGSAVVTGAGNLPARWVIHAVGPVYKDGRSGEPEQLASCYRTAMKLAQEKGAKSIAFPSISTGVYGYPMDEAADVALRTVCDILRQPGCTIGRPSLFSSTNQRTRRTSKQLRNTPARLDPCSSRGFLLPSEVRTTTLTIVLCRESSVKKFTQVSFRRGP